MKSVLKTRISVFFSIRIDFLWPFVNHPYLSLWCLANIIIFSLSLSAFLSLHISLLCSGFSISVVEEDGVQQLYITDVKAGGLAFAKG